MPKTNEGNTSNYRQHNNNAPNLCQTNLIHCIFPVLNYQEICIEFCCTYLINLSYHHHFVLFNKNDEKKLRFTNAATLHLIYFRVKIRSTQIGLILCLDVLTK